MLTAALTASPPDTNEGGRKTLDLTELTCSSPSPRSGPPPSAESFRYVQAESKIFMLYAPPLIAGSPLFREAFKVLLKGSHSTEPLILNGCTREQLNVFLWAVYVSPTPQLSELPLSRFLAISEMAHKLYYEPLRSWSTEILKALVLSQGNCLRDANTLIYIRLLRLAICYDQLDLAGSLQKKWLTRIHWRELSPVPAMLVAYANGFRHFFSHAAYVYMVDRSSIIASGLHGDPEHALSPEIYTHVSGGYHSFVAYWDNLTKTTLPLPADSECYDHSECKEAWQTVWSRAVDGPFTFPNCDVLRRLAWLEHALDSDPCLQAHMTFECRKAAIDAVAQKRAEISKNLYHYFDL